MLGMKWQRDEKGGNRLIRILLAMMIAVIWTGVLAGTAFAATPYAANGKLSVKNGKVINSQGKAFVIKGVSTHGIAWFPEYVNKKAFQTLRDEWGVNTIRLAMYTAEYNGYCSGGSQKELKTLIDQGVKAATDLGMYVIIDWHILSDGNPKTYQSQSNSFFKETAKKYSGYGNVMYEICNEPNGSAGSWKNVKSYASSVLKTIRSVNRNAIVIIGTPTWSQDVDTAMADPITGYSNIAYAFHFYAATHKASMRQKLETVLKNQFPVIVTEFGISEASGTGTVSTSEGNKWMTLLNKYDVGRVCWNLSNKNEKSALIKNSVKKTGGWTASDLTSSGKWLAAAYTGKQLSGTSVSDTSTAASDQKTQNQAQTADQGGASSGKADAKSKTSKGKVKFSVSVKKVNGWKNGSQYMTQYKVIVKNKSRYTSKQWKVAIRMNGSFVMSQKWSGGFQRKGTLLTIKPVSWNKKLKKGTSTEIGFIVKSNKAIKLKSVSVSAS